MFNGPSDFSVVLSLFSHSSNHVFTHLLQILPINFSLQFPIWFPQDLKAAFLHSLPKAFSCPLAHQITNSSIASLQILPLYHPSPDLSLAIQIKISSLSLSHISKNTCTITKQDVHLFRQCCTSLTLSYSLISLCLGAGKHTGSQKFIEGIFWAKTEVVEIGTGARWCKAHSYRLCFASNADGIGIKHVWICSAMHQYIVNFNLFLQIICFLSCSSPQLYQLREHQLTSHQHFCIDATMRSVRFFLHLRYSLLFPYI